MNAELVQLALRKQRLQLRSARQRAELLTHSEAFHPLFRGVDKATDAVLWARHNAPILSGLLLAFTVARPRVALRWGRRAWMGWKLLRRVNTLIAAYR